MLHSLYPTNVIVPEPDSSDAVPVQVDTTVQGPSVADFGGMCNNETSNDDVDNEVMNYRAVQEKSVAEVCPSEEDLARAINFYNECVKEDRQDAAISAMLMERRAVALSCNKITGMKKRTSPKEKRKIKIDVETNVQCSPRSDCRSLEFRDSEEHIVESIVFCDDSDLDLTRKCEPEVIDKCSPVECKRSLKKTSAQSPRQNECGNPCPPNKLCKRCRPACLPPSPPPAACLRKMVCEDPCPPSKLNERCKPCRLPSPPALDVCSDEVVCEDPCPPSKLSERCKPYCRPSSPPLDVCSQEDFIKRKSFSKKKITPPSRQSVVCKDPCLPSKLSERCKPRCLPSSPPLDVCSQEAVCDDLCPPSKQSKRCKPCYLPSSPPLDVCSQEVVCDDPCPPSKLGVRCKPCCQPSSPPLDVCSQEALVKRKSFSKKKITPPSRQSVVCGNPCPPSKLCERCKPCDLRPSPPPADCAIEVVCNKPCQPIKLCERSKPCRMQPSSSLTDCVREVSVERKRSRKKTSASSSRQSVVCENPCQPRNICKRPACLPPSPPPPPRPACLRGPVDSRTFLKKINTPPSRQSVVCGNPCPPNKMCDRCKPCRLVPLPPPAVCDSKVVCGNPCPPNKLCDRCKPCRIIPLPPPADCAPKAPFNLKAVCQHKLAKRSNDHICSEPTSCCNLCCNSKSGSFKDCSSLNKKGRRRRSGFRNCWIWLLLFMVGLSLLIIGFGLGYIVARHTNSTRSKTDLSRRNIESFRTQNVSMKPIYEPVLEIDEPLLLDLEPHKNHNERRNLPSLRPFVQVPFVPNTTWENPMWTWRCVDKRCQRLSVTSDVPLRSLQTCNMLCNTPKLWPKPTVSVSIATAVIPVRADQFSLEVLSSPSEIVRQHLTFAFQLLKLDLVALEKNLTKSPEIELGPPRAVLVRVAVKGDADVRMRFDTDESYRLSLSNTGDLLMADIRASSFCGARHAFETLSQIVWPEPAGATLLALEAVDIKDTPRFNYRGLLLDTTQHFINISEIMRTIDAMGANKLNTFHWHIGDTQSFPLRLNSVPQLAEHGSFGPHAIYTTDDVQTVVKRARLRGIRVILEIDLPNAGRAWNWKNKTDVGVLAYCVEAEPWKTFCDIPPCGYLNPNNPYVYDLLEKIYREILELTSVNDIFHLGWSGNPWKCWQKHFKNTDIMGLWFDYTKQALDALKRANKGTKPQHTIIWSPVMINKDYKKWLIEEDLTVQMWNETHPLTHETYIRTIISPWHMFYLDCRTLINCTTSIKSWQEIYNYRPWEGKSWRMLGGEVCLWNQPVDLDKHLWPKGMVLAERLWSDPTTKVDSEVYMRLDLHRSRLLIRGISSEPTWHAWCTKNPHNCVSP